MSHEHGRSNHHDHAHDHMSHHHHGAADGSIGIAFFLNLLFAGVELVGGLFTNSVAILSDAVHDLGDAATLGVSWFLERLSRRGRQGRLTYGFRRYNLLGAFISGVILLAGSLGILLEAIPRLFSPEPVEPGGMIMLALLGLLFNGAAVLRLRKGESANTRMVMLHLLEDILGWAAVFIGSVVIYFTGITWLDPLLSLGVTIFILAKAVPRLVEVGRLFLQYAPPDVDMEAVSSVIGEHPLVEGVHDIHLWSLDGRYTLLTAHVVVTPGEKALTVSQLDDLRQELKERLRRLNVDHATIEIEGKDAPCSGCDL